MRRRAIGSRCRRSAGIVDDVSDLSEIVERDGDHVLEGNGRPSWRFDGARERHIRVAEDGVNAQTEGLMITYMVSDLVRRPTIWAGGTGQVRVPGLLRAARHLRWGRLDQRSSLSALPAS